MNDLSTLAVIRQKIQCNWDRHGGRISFIDSYVGSQENPINLDEYQVTLEQLVLMTMLCSETDHPEIENLTPQQVEESDQAIETLGLDRNRWRYWHSVSTKAEQSKTLSVLFKADPVRFEKKKDLRKTVPDYMGLLDYKKMVIEFKIPENVKCIRSMTIDAVLDLF